MQLVRQALKGDALLQHDAYSTSGWLGSLESRYFPLVVGDVLYLATIWKGLSDGVVWDVKGTQWSFPRSSYLDGSTTRQVRPFTTGRPASTTLSFAVSVRGLSSQTWDIWYAQMPATSHDYTKFFEQPPKVFNAIQPSGHVSV